MTCLVRLVPEYPGQQLDLELLCEQLLFWSVTNHCTVCVVCIFGSATVQCSMFSSAAGITATMRKFVGAQTSKLLYYWRYRLDSNFIGTFNSLSPKGHKTFSGLSRNRTTALKISASAWSEFMATHSSVQNGAGSWMMQRNSDALHVARMFLENDVARMYQSLAISHEHNAASSACVSTVTSEGTQAPFRLQVFITFRTFWYCSAFVCIWQILSNYGLTRLKRFVSWCTIKLCN
jgi:hypothetical protein